MNMSIYLKPSDFNRSILLKPKTSFKPKYNSIYHKNSQKLVFCNILVKLQVDCKF